MAARESPADHLFHRWALWCLVGSGDLAGGSSMLARLIDSKGEIFFGESSGASVLDDGAEQQIEAAVMALAAKNLGQADALRLEFSAGYWAVCDRLGITNYDPSEATQLDRARALGLSWRTYKWRLATARQTVLKSIGSKYAKP